MKSNIIISCLLSILIVGAAVTNVFGQRYSTAGIKMLNSSQPGYEQSEMQKQMRQQLNHLQKLQLFNEDFPTIHTNAKNYEGHNTGTNGISAHFVRDGMVDGHGDVWLSTYGIDIYDGNDWKNIGPDEGLPHTAIITMMQSRDGTYWLGTLDDGLAILDSDLQHMRVLRAGENNLINNRVNHIFEHSSGRIFVAHGWNEEQGGGVSVFNEKGNHIDIIEGGFISYLAEGPDGNLWVSDAPNPETGEFGGIRVIDPHSLEETERYDKDNSELPQNNFHQLVFDSEGNLWAGSSPYDHLDGHVGGVYRFDGENWTHYDKNDGLPGMNTWRMYTDSKGRVWYSGGDSGTNQVDEDEVNNGVVFWDEENEEFASFESDIDLMDLRYVDGFMEDNSGNMYFTQWYNGIEGHPGGVSIWNREDDTWEVWSSYQGGVPAWQNAGTAEQSDGTVWTSGFAGVTSYNDGAFNTLTARDGLAATYAWKLLVDSNDNLWMGTINNGITRLDGETGEISTIEEFGVFQEFLYEARNGNIWLASDDTEEDQDGNPVYNGVLRYEPESDIYTQFTMDAGLPDTTMTSLAETPEGEILVGSAVGVYKADYDDNGNITGFSPWADEHVGTPHVNALLIDSQDRVWVGAGQHLSCYKDDNWTDFSGSDGVLPINALAEDNQGRIWAGGDHGLSIYEGSSKLKQITVKHGLPGSRGESIESSKLPSIHSITPSQTEENVIWLGTTRNGLVRLDAEEALSITGVEDVPNDQGGWVQLGTTGYMTNRNYAGEQPEYWTIWRSNEDGWDPVVTYEDVDDLAETIRIPVPYTKPSDEEPNDSNSFSFRVTAHGGAAGGLMVTSPSVMGYAEDNLAPGKIVNAKFEQSDGMVTMYWDEVYAPDLAGYGIFSYNDGNVDFSNPIEFTTETNAEVEDNGDDYVVAAKDVNSNYGELSDPYTYTSLDEKEGVPDRFALNQNYPNPFNPSTTIHYDIPEETDVKMDIFDMTGRRIATLVNEHKTPGSYQATFDASFLSSGMYLYRIRAGSFTETRKMTLVK